MMAQCHNDGKLRRPDCMDHKDKESDPEEAKDFFLEISFKFHKFKVIQSKLHYYCSSAIILV